MEWVTPSTIPIVRKWMAIGCAGIQCRVVTARPVFAQGCFGHDADCNVFAVVDPAVFGDRTEGSQPLTTPSKPFAERNILRAEAVRTNHETEKGAGHDGEVLTNASRTTGSGWVDLKALGWAG